MNFQCLWDSTAVSMTVISFVAILIAAIMCYVKMRYYINEEHKLYAWGCRFAIVLCIVILFFPALFCPLSVSIKNESIQIHRIISNIIVPFDEITEIRRLENSDTSNGKREFGSGGAFGYLGKFSSPKLGKYQMYATDDSKRILVKNKKGEYLIFSCDRPDELIKIVNTMP